MNFVDELLTRVRAAPGVRSAAAGSVVPFAGYQYGSVFSIEGRPDPAAQTGDWPMADVRASVTAEYLRVLGVPILEGRAFADTDRADTARVALVSRSLARRYWGSASAIGARIRFPGLNPPWITVVGVVADFKWNNLNEERNWATGAPSAGWLRTMYVPVSQTPFFDNNGMRILVRTDAAPQQVAANLRGVVDALDKDTPVSDVSTSEAMIAESVARPRFTALLLALFAGVALFLGAIGVYGVVAYAVGRRTQEFALRLALGANPQDVLRGVIAEGARLTIAGAGLGVAGALVATRALSTLLFGVTPADAGILASVALLLVAVGLLASYVPARRAMRVDPVTALQSE